MAINVGDRVTCTAEYEANLAEEDRGDSGIVWELRDDMARVGWASGVDTWIDLSDLQAE